jgi:hypothetical protein
MTRTNITALADDLQLIAAGAPPRIADRLHHAAAIMLDMQRAGDRMADLLDIVATGDLYLTGELREACNNWSTL